MSNGDQAIKNITINIDIDLNYINPTNDPLEDKNTTFDELISLKFMIFFYIRIDVINKMAIINYQISKENVRGCGES